MRKLALVPLALAALTVAACDPADYQNTASATATAPALEEVTLDPSRELDDTLSAEESRQMEFVYDATVIGDLTETEATDALAADVPQTVCQALSAGNSTEEVAAVAIEEGFTAGEATTLVAASVVNYCPEQADW